MESDISGAIFGFLGVLVGACVPWLQSAYSENRKRKNSAEYLALRVVNVLEKFILGCADVVLDDGTQTEEYNKTGCHQARVQTPIHITYPQDLDWKSIDVKLAFKLLALPNRIDKADSTIGMCSSTSEPPYFDEFFKARRKIYAEIGLEALKIEVTVREKYGLPSKEKYREARKIFLDQLANQ